MCTFGQGVDRELIGEISEEYMGAAHVLPYSALQIKAVFEEDELKEVAKFLKEVKSAADDNEKKAEAVEKFSKVAVKLLKLGGLIV